MTTADLPEPAAWRWRFDEDGQWSFNTTYPSGFRFVQPITVEILFTIDQFLAERQRAETAEALAETNQFWAEKEHAEAGRLSERLKEAEAIIAPIDDLGKIILAQAPAEADFVVVFKGLDGETHVIEFDLFRDAAQFMEAKP